MSWKKLYVKSCPSRKEDLCGEDYHCTLLRTVPDPTMSENSYSQFYRPCTEGNCTPFYWMMQLKEQKGEGG